MTAGLRLTLTALPAALVLALGAVPSAAQDTAANASQPAPASNGVIGPSELRDFSLGRPINRNPPTIAGPTTVPSAVPAILPPSSATPSRQPSPGTATAPANQPSSASPPAASQPQAAAPSSSEPDPSSSVTFALPSMDEGAPPRTASDEPPALGSQPGLVPVTPPESASIPLNSGPAMWPWLLAALLAGAGALYYAKQQRLRRAAAGDGAAFDPPQPAAEALQRTAAPVSARPVAAPPPEQPVSSRGPGTVVSARLRPRLDIQFIPERLIVEEDRTTLRFAAMLLNSGNAPALNVIVDAAMFNAGASQDNEIGGFFAHPLGRGERVPELLPLTNLTFRSEVTLPTSSLRLFEVAGRKLFVPLVAFNALYHWSGKDAQTSESFVVGIFFFFFFFFFLFFYLDYLLFQ